MSDSQNNPHVIPKVTVPAVSNNIVVKGFEDEMDDDDHSLIVFSPIKKWPM